MERSLQRVPDHRTGSRLGGAGGGLGSLPQGGKGAGKGRGGGGVRAAGRGVGREDPPGGLFQEGLSPLAEGLSSGVWEGREGHQTPVTFLGRGGRVGPSWVRVWPRHREPGSVLWSSGRGRLAWALLQDGGLVKFSPVYMKSGVFSPVVPGMPTPTPATSRCLLLPDTLHGLWAGEPGLALLCSPRAPGLWELPVSSGRQNLTQQARGMQVPRAMGVQC